MGAMKSVQFCTHQGGKRRGPPGVGRGRTSIVQDDVQERAVNLQAIVVVNEPQLAELVHEEADPRSGGADHLGQGLLTDLWNYRLGPSFLAEVRQEQQHPRQPLLRGVEQLVHEIFFNANVAGEEMRDEPLEKASSLRSTRSMAVLSSRTIEHGVSALAVAMRSG